MAILPTVLALVMALLSIVGFVYAATTQWRQTRDRGSVAIVPTLPLGVAASVVFTMALALLGTAQPALSLPGWAYIAFWIGSTAVAIIVLRLVSNRPTARR
jgi:hypothetical protein